MADRRTLVADRRDAGAERRKKGWERRGSYWRRLRRQKDEIMNVRVEMVKQRGLLQRAVVRATRLIAHPVFFVAHVVVVIAWIVLNLFPPAGMRPWDPYPFGLLTMGGSLEALFIALLILMHQENESSIAELREETQLQVALHGERETTKLLRLLEDVHRHLGIESRDLDDELEEMKQPLDPYQLRRSLADRLEMDEG